jgi:ribosome maturation factor RimP
MARLQQILESTAASLGFDLVDHDQGRHGVLRVFIEHTGTEHSGTERMGTGVRPGVTLADCERLSRQLQRVLEVEGIEFSRLEVSSPGLDRVLKKAADFRRFTGERAAVRLRVPENGRRRFVGVVRAATEEGVELEVDGTLVSFPFVNVEKARLVPRV